MATRPKTVQLKTGVDSAAMINAVLNDNPAFQNIPRAVSGDLASVHSIGTILDGDIDLSNSFIKSLFNRIIMTVMQSMYFTNPWRRFKRGFLEAGDIVEEIAFDLCNPHIYDSTDDTAYPKQEIPDAYVAIHKINYQKYYKRTINRKKLLRAFVTYNGMEDFVNEIISTLYTSAEYDEYVTMKYLLGRCALNGYITAVPVPDVTTEAGAKKALSTLQSISNNMTILRRGYNYSGVPTTTAKERQVLIVNSEFDSLLNVETLAYMFGPKYAELPGTKVLMDSFNQDDLARMNELFGEEENYVPFTPAEITALNSIGAFLLDERFFMIFDVEYEASTFFNPEKLYWNYWLHTWKIVSFSAFVNAICLSDDVQTLPQSIAITAPASVVKGTTAELTAAATWATGLQGNLNLVWEVTGSPTGVSVTKTGATTATVSVTGDATATSITVTATQGSGAQSVQGTATITVSAS